LYDPGQLKLMEEQCIRVDESDNVIGPVSKKECHLNMNIRQGMLHRAFSAFIFNREGKLLLQQRAQQKITFPEYWTNTCCSHPVYHVDPVNTEHGRGMDSMHELELKSNLGIKRAVRRKLWHELGISGDALPADDKFQYITRIHYKSENGSADGIWGEHEIDHIVFIQPDEDVQLKPRSTEVMDYKYVSQTELKEFLAMAESKGLRITPWFKLIADNYLYTWWDALLAGTLEKHFDHDTVHKMC